MNLYPSKTYLSREHPFAYATLTNFGNGMGLLQIHSDWGAYSAFWPAMGDETLEEFLISADMSYVHGCLRRGLVYQEVKKSGLGRLDRFMIECWPKLIKIIAEESAARVPGEG